MISSATRRLQLFVEITLPPLGRILGLFDGVAPAAARLEGRPPVREPGRESGKLLDGTLDREADRTDSFVRRLHRIHGAVCRSVELVELQVDPVHRTPDLVDYRQNFTLCSPNQRRKSIESYGQPEKGPRNPETNGNEKHREGEIREISEGEGENHRYAD